MLVVVVVVVVLVLVSRGAREPGVALVGEWGGEGGCSCWCY